MRILIAEDEKSIATHVATHLERCGYQTVLSSNGQEIWELGGTEDFVAIVLDLGLPDLDGLTLLRRWRREGIQTPVLILSARGSWMERVDGFDSGADDYLPKPFRIEELIARLRALIRRSAKLAHDTEAIRAGRLTVLPHSREVRLDDVVLDVTPSEFRALLCLAQAGQQPVPTLALALDALGREDDKAGNAAEVLVNRLRSKLGKDVILTRRGFGYVLARDGQ